MSTYRWTPILVSIMAASIMAPGCAGAAPPVRLSHSPAAGRMAPAGTCTKPSCVRTGPTAPVRLSRATPLRARAQNAPYPTCNAPSCGKGGGSATPAQVSRALVAGRMAPAGTCTKPSCVRTGLTAAPRPGGATPIRARTHNASYPGGGGCPDCRPSGMGRIALSTASRQLQVYRARAVAALCPLRGR